MDLHLERRATLAALLAELPDVVVAFSGGVDSGVLLHAAVQALGPRAVALTGDSASLPRRELEEAQAFARALGARFERLATDELASEDYRRNDGTRCFHCRHALFTGMEAWARARGFTVLAYGEVTDDLSDHRPGRAAARAFAVRAPLCEAGFSKDDVRRYAREHGLALADKPAAACLASRLPIGTRVTAAALARIEAAEEALRALGLRELRVRDHGTHARVELGPGELAQAAGSEARLATLLAEHGFATLELAPYRRGGAGTQAPPTNSASR